MIAYLDPITNNVASCTLASSVPDGVTGYEVDAPQDRAYRNAWVINAGVLEYDLVKAKAEAHDKRKNKRRKDFDPYRDDYDLEVPAAAAQVVQAKIDIRTADGALETQVDAAADIDALKAISLD